MPNFNSGYVFNAKAEDMGFFWNGADYVLVIRLHETLRFLDKLSLKLASMILSEQGKFIYGEIVQSALIGVVEPANFEDKSSYYVLFFLADKFGIKDEVADLIVLSYIHDKMKLVEQAKQFADMLVIDDTINVEDISTVDALLELIDSFGFEDLYKGIQYVRLIHDQFGMTDHMPKTAISDFIIGIADNYDTAYDWLLPFGLKIDWATSTIQVMPETELTTIEMPGIDGSIVEDAVYKDRLFQIVAFSEQGLGEDAKEEIKAKITNILDSTKHKTKKLTVQDRGVSFDVRYDGLANIVEGPSYVKATIPFRAGPYGYGMYEETVTGNGLINNDGDAPLGVVNIIEGPVSNPAFSMGTEAYSWSGNIPSGYSLVIDHNMLTCYLQDSFGVKKNAMKNLKGKFQKIEPQKGVVLTAASNTVPKIRTEWKTKVLW